MGVAPAAVLFRRDEIAADFAAALSILDTDTPDGSRQKRPLTHARSLFLKNDLTGALPLGQMEALGLGYEAYSLTFTATTLTARYGAASRAPCCWRVVTSARTTSRPVGCFLSRTTTTSGGRRRAKSDIR